MGLWDHFHAAAVKQVLTQLPVAGDIAQGRSPDNIGTVDGATGKTVAVRWPAEDDAIDPGALKQFVTVSCDSPRIYEARVGDYQGNDVAVDCRQTVRHRKMACDHCS